MKKIFAFVLVAAAMTAACTKEEINSIGEDSKTCTISAYVSEDGGTKVAVQDNGDYISHIWKTGDAIAVFDGTTKKEFTLSEGAETSKGTFTGEALAGTAPFYAIYPYSEDASISEGVITTEFKATQTYTAGSYDKDAVVMVSSTENITEPLPFKLASSFIEITLKPETGYTVKKVEVTSNGGEIIAGTGEVSYNSGTPSVNMTSGVPTVAVDFGADGQEMTAGTSYTFYVALPAVTLASGVSVAITGNDNKMILKKSSILELERNVVTCMPELTAVPNIINLSLANSAAVGLSTPETANCYMISCAGKYAIPVDIMGNGVNPYTTEPKIFNNGSAKLPVAASATKLWDYGNILSNSAPKVYGKYVAFETPEDFNKGNAVVTIKDSDESKTILWSWHIWATDYAPTMDVKVGDFYFMTKDLGQNEETCDRITYNWGRKDPFDVRVTTIRKTSSTMTMDFGVKNPDLVFAKAGYTGGHGIADSDQYTWNNRGLDKTETEKTIFDPSPVGYCVPPYNAVKTLYDNGLKITGTKPNVIITINGTDLTFKNIRAYFDANNYGECYGYYSYCGGEGLGNYSTYGGRLENGATSEPNGIVRAVRTFE